MTPSSSDSEMRRLKYLLLWASIISPLLSTAVVAMMFAAVVALSLHGQGVEQRLQTTEEHLEECVQERTQKAEEVGKQQGRLEDQIIRRAECERKLGLCALDFTPGDTDVDDDQ